MNFHKSFSMLSFISCLFFSIIFFCGCSHKLIKKPDLAVVSLDRSKNNHATTVPEFTAHGYLKTKDLKVENTLTIYGKAEIERLNASTAIVCGSFTGKNITILENLTVKGFVNLEEASISGTASFFGGIKIKAGYFKNVEISSTLATFLGTTIDTLLVKEDRAKRVQIIELFENSTISGDVTFEQKNGEVHLGKGSRVLGKVNGGIIIVKS